MPDLESSIEETGHVAVAIQIKLGVWQLFDNEVSIRVEQQDLFYLDVLKQRLGWTYDLAYATAAFYVPTEMFARSFYTEMEEKEFVKHAYWIK